jgi:quinol monooxygenase YgiN
MIHVIATLEVVSGSRAAFLAEFAKIVPLVHAEVGCLHYTPTIDADTGLSMQTRIGPDKVTVIEQWTTVEALEAHGLAPHMQAHRDRVKHLVCGREVRVLVAG